MRKSLNGLLAAAVVVCLASSANAASMQLRLVATQVGTTTTWDVAVQAQTDTPEGIKGFQFDILSEGNGLTAPLAAVPPSKANITWNVAGFSFINPNKVDAAAPAYPGDADTDHDALGASFSDPNNFNNLAVGVGGWTTVATEKWVMTSANAVDFLVPYVIGAQYYDFTTGTAPGFAFAYPAQNVTTTGAQVGLVPEPASLVLVGLCAPALAFVIRRRKTA
jgi:hypothetical protein